MGISETTGFAGNEVKWTDYYMSVHFLFEPDKQLTSDLAVGGGCWTCRHGLLPAV